MDEPIRKSQPVAGRGTHKALALVGALSLMGAVLYAYRPALPAPAVAAEDAKEKDKKPTPKAVAAAKAFLESLEEKQREKAALEFDNKKKPNWSNLPTSFVPRNGARLGDLSKEQREKAMAVIAAVLSKDGYQKVIDIMDGDQKLTEGKGGKDKGKDKGKDGKGKDKGKGPTFGKDEYYLAIFGTPSETKPWMVQFGGHHLGVNVTVIGKHFVLTPTHTGTQPALFQRDKAEVRPLGREVDTAQKLMDSLDKKQRTQAIIGEKAQGELLLGPGRDGKKVEPKGIKGDALSKEQQGLLLDVIGAWVNVVESDSAAERMAAIKEKIAETYFAWSGPTEKGKAAYFRVQGPAVVIEYAPQGGTDHIHTVIRNPENDYGAGLIDK